MCALTRKGAVERLHFGAAHRVLLAFADAGIDFLSRNIVKSSDTANTLDSKVLFQIDEIRSAESMDPRRIITLAEEVGDVDQARANLLAECGTSRFGMPADIARACAFLASNKAEFFQGSLIDLDGGETRGL